MAQHSRHVGLHSIVSHPQIPQVDLGSGLVVVRLVCCVHVGRQMSRDGQCSGGLEGLNFAACSRRRECLAICCRRIKSLADGRALSRCFDDMRKLNSVAPPPVSMSVCARVVRAEVKRKALDVLACLLIYKHISYCHIIVMMTG